MKNKACKRIKRGSTLALIILTFIFVISSSIGLLTFADNVKQLETSTISFNGQYFKNDYFEVPKMIFTVGDTNVEATHEVVSPSGEIFTSKQFYLDSRGEYKINYSAKIDGKLYTKTEKFNVDLKLFETSKGEEEVVPAINPYYENAKGQMVTLSRSGVFYYNKTIDASKFSSAPFLRFYVVPEAKGVPDIDTLFIRLTDKYDPNNYILFRAVYSATAYGFPGVFWCAGNDEMGMLGIETYNGNIQKDWTGVVPSSFCAHKDYEGTGRSNSECSLSLNYGTKAVSVANSSTPVIDLDNKEHFDILWKGFTTGECYLSMWAEGFKSTSPAKILITSIANENLYELENERVVDVEKPIIDIDFGEYAQDNLPIGVVGMEYKVLDALAIDKGAQAIGCSYSISAYMDYAENGEKYPVPILPNYRVFPTNVGDLTVVYKAIDLNGNIGYSQYTFKVVNSLDDIYFEYQDKLSCKAGDLLNLNNFIISNVSGNPEVKIIAKESSKEIIVNNGMFRPLEEGLLQITYEIKDYLGRTKKEIVEIVVSGKTGAIENLPILPKYLMNGVPTILELPNAWDYTFDNGVKAVDVMIKTSDNSGENVLTGQTYIPNVVQSGDKAKISYLINLSDGTQVETEEFEIPVIITRSGTNNKIVEIENYFVCLDGEISKQAKSDSVALTTSNNAQIDFIKPVLADDFQLEFSIDEGSAFNKIVFTLTDSVNPKIKLDISIYEAMMTNEGKTVKMTVLSLFGRKYKLSSPITGGGRDFQITYDNNDLYVKEKGTSKITVRIDTEGNKFYGFTSNKVYLAISMEATASSTLNVKRICAQEISNISNDFMPPIIQIPLGYGGGYNLGDIVKLNGAVACDVLNELSTFAVTVTSPSGKPVTSIDGIELNGVDPTKAYTIKIAEYGFYSINYNAVDTNNRVKTFNYVLLIIDTTAPNIAFENETPKTLNVGDKLVLPGAKLSDNVSNSIQLYIVVFEPDLSRVTITGKSYTFNKVGDYKFNYVAIDESGNVQIKTFIVTVTE